MVGTARIYTDLSLMTANAAIGKDVHRLSAAEFVWISTQSEAGVLIAVPIYLACRVLFRIGVRPRSARKGALPASLPR